MSPGPHAESGKNLKDMVSSPVKTSDSLITPLEPLKLDSSHQLGRIPW